MSISVKNKHYLLLTNAGRVLAFGDNVPQVTEANGRTNIITVSAGEEHSLLLTDENRVLAYGSELFNEVSGPYSQEDIVSVSAGYYHSLLLTSGGKVLAYGNDQRGQVSGPDGQENIVAISAGYGESILLTSEGAGLIFGDRSSITRPQHPKIIAILSGWTYSLFLTVESEVKAHGFVDYPSSPDGEKDIIAMAAGSKCILLTSEGKVKFFGDTYSQNRSHLFPQNVTAISVGKFSHLLLTADGVVLVYKFGQLVDIVDGIKTGVVPDGYDPYYFNLLQENGYFGEKRVKPVIEPPIPNPQITDTDYFTYEQLALPGSTLTAEDIDVRKRENYLSPGDFEEYFNMTKEEFAALSGALQNIRKNNSNYLKNIIFSSHRRFQPMTSGGFKK